MPWFTGIGRETAFPSHREGARPILPHAEWQPGIAIVSILPESREEKDGVRRFVLYPGGVVPRIGLELANRKGTHRIVRVDPITGVPQIERVEGK